MKPIVPYYISQPTFCSKRKAHLTVKDINGVIPVGKNIDIDNWIVLYNMEDEQYSWELLNGLLKCCKGYNIRFSNNDSNWIPMESHNIKDWIDTVERELPFSTLSFSP